METYASGSEAFQDGVLYAASFPLPTKEIVEAELATYPKPSAEEQVFLKRRPESIAQLLGKAESRYSYHLRPHAMEEMEQFVGLAITLSKEFEISMEIRRMERSVNVKMDILSALPLFGACKEYLDALLCMASEYCVRAKDSTYVTLELDYALYDRYDNKTGEQVN